MNMMSLSQLTLAKKHAEIGLTKERLTASDTFNELIVELATRNPLWNFVVTDLRTHSFKKSVVEITIYQHGEELGTIGWDYFRSDYGFKITNHRIKSARNRTSSYRTHDVKKALAAIKKSFASKNVSERVAHEVSLANSVLREQIYTRNREARTINDNIKTAKVDFADTLPAEFKAYMQLANKAHVLEKHDTLTLEMKTLNDLEQAFDSGKSALVIKTDSGYIVRHNDKVEILDDATLPNDMKVKLGMLKLVDNEHFITNIGGKVKADVFVLAPNQEGETE